MNIRGLYFLTPIAAFVFWTATLLGLLLWWTVDDNAMQYKIDQATVVFISNVGAVHKALFVTGCALTCVFWTLTLLTERWLRHIRRIPGSLHKRETTFDIVSVVFGILGGISLLMLSIFDAVNYKNVHWSFTAVFVVCIAVSALFQTLETMSLERDHVDRKHLRRAAITKLCIVVIALCGAVAFAATYATCAGASNDAPPDARCNVIQSTAASLEWFIAFLYDAYILTFVFDLWPARKTAGRKFTPDLVEKDRQNILHEHKDGRPGAPRGEIEDYPRPGFGAENETNSGVSYPDSIGRPVGRASEDQAAMRHV